MERKIQKGFNLNHVENVMESMFEDAKASKKPKDIFKRIAKMVNDKDKVKKMEAEGQRRSSIKRDQIGSTTNSIKRQRNSLKKSLMQRGNSQAEIKMVLTRLNSEELVAFNPMLADIAPEARRAYAKFKDALNTYNDEHEKGALPGKEGPPRDEAKIEKQRRKESIRKMVIEKAKSIESCSSIDDEKSAINKAVKDLEDVIDGGGSSKGVDNKAFDDKITPPPKEQATPAASTKTTSASNMEQIPTPGQRVSDTSKEASPVASPRPTPKMPNITLQPATLDSQQLATDGDSKQPTPRATQQVTAKVTPQPSPSKIAKDEDTKAASPASPPKKAPAPQPSTSTAPASAPEASGSSKKKSTKEPPKEEEPVGEFDPYGKSAISGQKRTGWM